MRISWLYLAMRSERDSEPVLICPQLVATARSAMVESSDRKSTRLNSSHLVISYAVFCLKKKKTTCSFLVYALTDYSCRIGLCVIFQLYNIRGNLQDSCGVKVISADSLHADILLISSQK